ncbi:hypothetical protein [Mucilaginibacter jinjuensis]|uniref:LTXXQ motif family protein n=1 Tax=Mucilaginibacter jinjuensis TaxID=1176721 RepID=A0ABY7TCI5_9SPHI|nr:hypothetical protein [Mucilaginibacter jinjuensis]WCT13918.1 hypothetical protein PQO05_08225 [Mucilaginibacter jinjuensis]
MNNLIKYLFFALLLFCIRHETCAQPGASPYRSTTVPNYRPNFNGHNRPDGMRKLNAVRNDYINKRLNLTPEEADRFWPVYNQYQAELGNVLRQRRINNSSPQANGIDQVDRDINYEQQILSIRKRYKDEFLKILPPEKVSLLYKSEREFKDELIKQLGERKQQEPQK